MARRVRPGDRVEVEWQDAVSQPGWQPESAAEELRPLAVASIGFLLRNDAIGVTIIQSRTESSFGYPFAEALCIPRGMVRRVRPL